MRDASILLQGRLDLFDLHQEEPLAWNTDAFAPHFLKTQLSVSLSCRMDSAAWLVSSNCPEKIAHQNAAPIKITSNREIGSSRNKDASMAYPCAAAACQPPCGRVYLRYKRQELAATASEESSMVMAASHGATRPNAANGVISRCQATEPYKFCRATSPVA